jgi:hypothetical protein
MKPEMWDGKPVEYFWCTACSAVNTDVAVEYVGGCWRCGGQMMKSTGQRPPDIYIRECHKNEKKLIRSGRDACGRDIVAKAVAACGYRLKKITVKPMRFLRRRWL